MQKRSILMTMVLCAVVGVATYGTYVYYQEQSKKTTVTLAMDYHMLRSPERYDDIGMPENATVLDLLRETTEVVTKETRYGKMIISINGISQDPDRNLWWIYTVNGEVATAGAETQLLSDGDVIQWKLTEY